MLALIENIKYVIIANSNTIEMTGGHRTKVSIE